MKFNYECTCCLHGAGRNDFHAGNPFWGPLEGVGPKIKTFWALKWQPPPPPPIQPFVHNNSEINSDMKSALDRPPVRKTLNCKSIEAKRTFSKKCENKKTELVYKRSEHIIEQHRSLWIRHIQVQLRPQCGHQARAHHSLPPSLQWDGCSRAQADQGCPTCTGCGSRVAFSPSLGPDGQACDA